MAHAKGSEEAKAWAAKMKAAREAKKAGKAAAEHPVVREGREEMKERKEGMKAARKKKAAKKAEPVLEPEERISMRDALAARVRAAKEGQLMAPAKKHEEPSFASEEIKEVEEHPLKKAMRKVKEKRERDAAADLVAEVKEEVKVEPETRVMGKREAAKREKQLNELRKKMVEASPAGKEKAEKEKDDKKSATKEKRLAALAKAREAKKAKKAAAVPKAEEKKEEKKEEPKKEEAPVSKPEASEKETLGAARKEIKELRKKFCPPVAKMRKPDLLHELKRLRVKEGIDPEDKDIEDMALDGLRRLVKLLRAKHCPPISKMRKPALLAELKELKERAGHVEKSDYGMTTKEMKKARRKEAVAMKKKRIADRVQAKKMEKEGTMKELGGRD